jgi:hypothetical protein
MTDPDPDLDVDEDEDRFEPQADPTRFPDPVADLVKRAGITPGLAFLIGVAIYGLGEKILLPLIQGYFHVGGDISTWRPDIEALVNGFIFFPTLLAAYVWQIDGTHEVFVQFARGESFADKRRFADFMGRAAAWFDRPWWILSAVLGLVGVAVANWWLWDPQNPKPVAPWWQAGEPLSRVVALMLMLPAWYFTSQIVLGQVRLASALRRLWREVGSSYKPVSRNRTSGVNSLSRNVSILTTVGAVVLLNVILGLLLPQIRDTNATPDFFLWAVIIWAAYLVAVPGITLALLWPAHVIIDDRRDERIELIVRAIDARYASAEDKLRESKPAPEIDELGQLRSLRDWLEQDLSSWPLPEPLRAVAWSTVVPISLTVLTIVLDRFL